MKFAMIGPAEVLYPQIDVMQPYHMALGQFLLTDKKYLELYRTLHQLGHFIMVDNGVAEGGDAMKSGYFEGLLNLVIREDFDEIVLPDVFKDGDKSNLATLTFIDMVPYTKRAVVIHPQGGFGDATGWFDCLTDLSMMVERAQSGPLNTLCIPKHLKEERYPILKELHRKNYDFVCNIHILGLSNNPMTEIPKLLATGCRIRGIDSSAPVAWAQYGRSFRDDLNMRYSIDWNGRGNPDLIKENLLYMKRLCSGY